MEKNEVLAIVNDIFTDVLDREDVVLTYEMKAGDVKDWDSLTHIQLVVAIEKKLKLRFTSQEIQRWKNVGEMLDCILSKNV